MKSPKFAALFATSLISCSSFTFIQPQATVAATFGQTEVNQNKFIAIAIPRSDTYYNLTILEQVSDQRPCWQESGNSPTTIEPLLLGFNFSGICGRNSDSNGYSIRHQGQDLGMKYRLTLRRRSNDVVLLGVPSSSTQESVVIGRTQGVSSSLMKIDLDPGWKFTKRNYQGRTLGHVYLTHEGKLPTGKAEYSSRRSNSSRKSSRKKAKKSTPTIERVTTVAKATSSDRFYRLYVKPTTSRQARLVKSMVPGSFRSSYRGQSVIQAGLFSSRSKARSLEKKLNRKGLRTSLIEEKGAIPIARTAPPSPGFPAVPSGPVLRVPSSRVPLGNARGEGDVYGRGNTSTPPPPPNPTLALAKRYRVLVPASSSNQQSRIRSLVKDSFRSSYRGQSAMQVGSFTSMSEAQAVINLMQRNGFRTIID